jgi:hypothetical protein
MTAVAPAEVVGRHPELERIGGFLDPGRGELALLLEGAAGIGKTTLWCAGIELARRQQFRVLWCQPTASETAFSFAALGDLLSPVVQDVLPRLPPPQRAAIGAALALVEHDVPSVDERPCCRRCACSPLVTRCWWRSTTCSGWIRRRRRCCGSPPGGSRTSV